MSIDLFSADFSRLGDSELFDAISEFTRQALPQPDRTQEGYTVDFKEKWADKSLKVVAAFANTFGGLILIGVSEQDGRAKDLVGEESKGELKTRFASAIASNITPCPSFDIAECGLPGQPGRRLAVIRVRTTNRIHLLTKKGLPPVFVRNEDEAIEARAAELRSLIQREREAENPSQVILDQGRLLNLLPITKAADPDGMGGPTSPVPSRKAAESYLRLWAIPSQTWNIDLDYDLELTFRDLVFKTFPADSFVNDVEWSSFDDMVRDRDYVRLDYSHLARDLESKWALTSAGEFGYATLLAERYGPNAVLWSLSDVTMELLAAIRTAHALLTRTGYLGEMSLYLFADPGGGVIHQERGELSFMRHTSDNRAAPSTRLSEVIPKAAKAAIARQITCFMSANFSNRTEGLVVLVAELLNQLLRSLGHGASVANLRKYVGEIAAIKV